MNDLVYYSPQHEGIILNEEGKLQSLSNSTSIRRESSSNSLGKARKSSSSNLTNSMVSLASDASSCARISPPNSFHNGMRRSTFDLSDFNATTGACRNGNQHTLRYRGHSSSSQQRHNCGAATQALLDLSSASRNSMSSFTSQHSSSEAGTAVFSPEQHHQEDDHHTDHSSDDHFMGLETVIEDVFLGYMSILLLVVNMHRQLKSLLLGMKSLVGKAWDSLSHLYHFEEPLERQPCQGSNSSNDSVMHKSNSEELLLTPLKLVAASKQEAGGSKDEWGHFADFQEELADEASFIPSCSRIPAGRSTLRKPSTSGLAPLAEVHEDDHEEAVEEEEWCF